MLTEVGGFGPGVAAPVEDADAEGRVFGAASLCGWIGGPL